MSLEIKDNLTPGLRRPDTRGLMQAIAKAVEVETRRHWRTMNGQRPNKDGLPRANFWLRHGYDATAVLRVTETTAEVRMGDGAMRYQAEGGVIRPLAGKKGLTIPRSAEAKRAGSARLFPRALQFIPTPGYGGLIGMLLDIPIFGIRARKNGIRNVKREGTIQYHVVSQVSKGPDPSVVPDRARFDGPMAAAAAAWLRAWRRS